MLKKADSKEIERAISIVIVLIFLGMAVTYILQLFAIIKTDRIMIPEVVFVIGSLFLLLFIVKYFSFEENRHLKLYDLLFLGMLCSVILSTVFSDNVQLSLSGNDKTCESTFVLIGYLIIGFSASLISNDKDKRIMYFGFTIFGIIQFIMGLMQTWLIHPYIKDMAESNGVDVYRAFGTINNANPYASVMLIFVALECSLIYKKRTLKQVLLHTFLLSIYFLCILLSGTRGALLGFCFAALVCSLILVICGAIQKQKVVKIISKLIYVIIIVAVIIVANKCFSTDETSDLNYFIDRTQNELKSKQMGEERLIIWEETLKRCFYGHEIFGMGPSGVHFAYILQDLNDPSIMEAPLTFVQDAHNRYINILATQGIVGLIVYLLLIIYCLVVTIKRLIKSSVTSERYDLFYLFALLGYLVADCFCIGLFTMVSVFYVLLGLMINRKETNDIIKNKNIKN